MTSAIATLAAVAGAQEFTSPKGFSSIEGDESHFAIFNPSYQRFMQIDDTLTGTPVQNIKAIGLRRDGEWVSPSGGPRTIDLTVMMGHGDYTTISGTFAANYKGQPTTVFTKKTINTPDWSMLAPVQPAPFDFRAAFDTKWSYNGNDALVYELHMENVSQTGSPNVDRELGSGAAFNQSYGTTSPNTYGCLVAGFGLEMGHSLFLANYGASHPQYAMRLGIAVQRAPPGQATILNVDLSDPNLAVPGLCARLHALPVVTVGLGNTNATGSIDLTWYDFPYTASFEGKRIFTQAVTLDPTRLGIPAALSNDRTASMPVAPRPAPATSYLYGATVTTAAATLWQNRGIITRFDY